ncbi:MAG: AmmeMemoRadiSam system protein A [Patescibacteria group bacterium]|nr:AmmeMemoRadiSam system protein A [Patescibacteria group bacterium]
MGLALLAKLAIENYIEKEKIISTPDNLPKKFLNKKSGVFITIKKNGNLKGCIGTYLPTKKNIAEETIQNAIVAATKDYRFEPIRKEELPELSYIVYILEKPKLIKNIKELNPKIFGVIVKTNNPPLKSGLLLPGLKGIDTIEKQLSDVCQKAGINPVKEEIIIYKFIVKKFC